MKQTIVSIAYETEWNRACAAEPPEYRWSTLDKPLEAVGFLHCSFPDQTMGISERFAGREGVCLLLIDIALVRAEVKFEGALSGRAGEFPHIYGPLNTDAVYEVLPLQTDPSTALFIEPESLIRLRNMPDLKQSCLYSNI